MVSVKHDPTHHVLSKYVQAEQKRIKRDPIYNQALRELIIKFVCEVSSGLMKYVISDVSHQHSIFNSNKMKFVVGLSFIVQLSVAFLILIPDFYCYV